MGVHEVLSVPSHPSTQTFAGPPSTCLTGRPEVFSPEPARHDDQPTLPAQFPSSNRKGSVAGNWPRRSSLFRGPSGRSTPHNYGWPWRNFLFFFRAFSAARISARPHNGASRHAVFGNHRSEIPRRGCASLSKQPQTPTRSRPSAAAMANHHATPASLACMEGSMVVQPGPGSTTFLDAGIDQVSAPGFMRAKSDDHGPFSPSQIEGAERHPCGNPNWPKVHWRKVFSLGQEAAPPGPKLQTMGVFSRVASDVIPKTLAIPPAFRIARKQARLAKRMSLGGQTLLSPGLGPRRGSAF